MSAGQAKAVPVTIRNRLAWSDLSAALAAGWADYRAAPLFGLFFAGIYVAAGLALATTEKFFKEIKTQKK